jgi:hypothetical protein
MVFGIHEGEESRHQLVQFGITQASAQLPIPLLLFGVIQVAFGAEHERAAQIQQHHVKLIDETHVAGSLPGVSILATSSHPAG